MLRISFLIGTLALLAAVMWSAGSLLLRDARLDSMRDHHESSAHLAAAHVDDVLARTIDREQHLARMVAGAWESGEIKALEVLDYYPSLLFESDLHLIRSQGEVVWSMGTTPVGPSPMTSEPAVMEAASSLQNSISECASRESEGLACIATPIASGGELSAVLLAEIDLGSEAVDLMSLESLNDEFSMTLLGEHGAVLASNEPSDFHSIDATRSSGLSDSRDLQPRTSLVPIDRVAGWTVALTPKDPGTAPFLGDESGWLLLVALAALAAASVSTWIALRGTSGQAMPTVAVTLGEAQALARMQIDERERMSHELGEDAAQSLAALAMTLSDVDPSDDDAGGRISQSRAMALQVMTDIRGVAARLYPPTLSVFGLEAAIESFVERRFADGSVDVHVASLGPATRLDSLVESVLFRVTQELIDDIDRRSKPSAVLITIETAAAQVRLVIEDDGVLSADTQQPRTAVALARQLLSPLRGTVEAQSDPEQGTRIIITVER